MTTLDFAPPYRRRARRTPEVIDARRFYREIDKAMEAFQADVSYAVYQYWQVTGDDEFMQDYGAEIILDTARFWGSRAE